MHVLEVLSFISLYVPRETIMVFCNWVYYPASLCREKLVLNKCVYIWTVLLMLFLCAQVIYSFLQIRALYTFLRLPSLCYTSYGATITDPLHCTAVLSYSLTSCCILLRLRILSLALFQALLYEN